MFLTEGAFDRLVLASRGVTRDFLGILRRSILIARERGDTARGTKESQRLEDEVAQIGEFVKERANANVFLVDKDLPDAELANIEELVNLRLVHRVKSAVTVRDRPGKKFEAFMLDIRQYTAARKKRDLDIIEFWRADATDLIRRSGLIHKEMPPKKEDKRGEGAPQAAADGGHQ
jgi:hypothetical protein